MLKKKVKIFENVTIQKVSWTDRITNKEVLERVSERKSMWKSIQRRRN